MKRTMKTEMKGRGATAVGGSNERTAAAGARSCSSSRVRPLSLPAHKKPTPTSVTFNTSPRSLASRPRAPVTDKPLLNARAVRKSRGRGERDSPLLICARPPLSLALSPIQAPVARCQGRGLCPCPARRAECPLFGAAGDAGKRGAESARKRGDKRGSPSSVVLCPRARALTLLPPLPSPHHTNHPQRRYSRTALVRGTKRKRE